MAHALYCRWLSSWRGPWRLRRSWRWRWRWRRRWRWRPLAPLALLAAAMALLAPVAAGPRYSSRIVDTQSGAIRGIIVEPESRRLEPVEVFLGVPYAAQPERLAPTPEAPRWQGTRLADHHAPVCPQTYPDISNRTASLMVMPRGRYHYLQRLIPLLANQSEDCLHLNIFIPGSGARGVEAPYAVLVWLPGGSFDFGTANEIDGSVLAADSHLIVVTVNIRLGLLGFLPLEDVTIDGECFALQDALAAIQWVKRNIASFGGDPTRVTLAGHDTGAALVSFLLADDRSKGLVHRAILMSGGALSPWAASSDPGAVRAATARQLGCGGAPLPLCARARPLRALLAVEPPALKFRGGWAPAAGAAAAAATARALDKSAAFVTAQLMIGVATTESYDDFSANDIQYGFEEDYRNRVLRTYIRNAYVYHLNEIFAAVRNEYTDWDKPVQHPINIRDATLEALSDAATVAPSLRLAHLHARRGAPTYLFHFHYQNKDTDYPQRLGSVRGSALPYLLGQPLLAEYNNYSRQDSTAAESLLALVAAFVKGGDPGMAASGSDASGSQTDPPSYPDYGRERARYRGPAWLPYEPTSQQYLSFGVKPRMRSHYRGHKMALWLNLIPQLHRPGASDVTTRHHHFKEKEPHYYVGSLRPESFTVLYRAHQLSLENEDEVSEFRSAEACDTEEAGSAIEVKVVLQPETEADLLQSFTTKQYYSYTLALGVTVAIGCFLLALNVLIFAGIYMQRGKTAKKSNQQRQGPQEADIEATTAATTKQIGTNEVPLNQRGSILGIGPPTSVLEETVAILIPSQGHNKHNSDYLLPSNKTAFDCNSMAVFSPQPIEEIKPKPKKRVQIQEASF